MRISDWSSDVCSSDLRHVRRRQADADDAGDDAAVRGRSRLAGDEAWQAAPDHAVDGVPVERAQGFAADRPVLLDGRSYLPRLSSDGRVEESQVTPFVTPMRNIDRRGVPLHPLSPPALFS